MVLLSRSLINGHDNLYINYHEIDVRSIVYSVVSVIMQSCCLQGWGNLQSAETEEVTWLSEETLHN